MSDHTHTAIQEHLLAWVGSEDGYSFLLSLSSRIMREVKKNGALAVMWPFSDESYAVDEMAHDFYLFLAGTFFPNLNKTPDLLFLAENNETRKLFEYARKKFLWSLQEKSRNKAVNPAGYLYRRLRETVSASSSFICGKGVNNAFLFRPVSGENTEELVQTSLSEENLSAWPVFPESSGVSEMKEVCKSMYLHDAALFFWDEANRRTAVQALAVRDLQRYLLSIHPWLHTPSETLLREETEVVSRTDPDPDIRLHTASLSFLAEQLIGSWRKEQCAVFLLRLEEPPVKLKDIAVQLGLANHNTVHRLFAACMDSIIMFSSNWPGPPLAELPEECAEIFLEQVKRCAKKRIGVRNEE